MKCMVIDVDKSPLTCKLRAWSKHPKILAHNWSPCLFWRPAKDTDYGKLRVDPTELEVYFAAMLDEPSEYRELLDRTRSGRGCFLAANARRHELPLFSQHPTNTNG